VFCCLLDLDGEPVSPTVRARYEGRVRAMAGYEAVEQVDAGGFVAWVVPARVPHRQLWARRAGFIAVGNVRLDHPEDFQRWTGIRDSQLSTLELMLDGYAARGPRCLREMVGDFAVIVYSEAARTLVAARDAFGVKAMFRSIKSGVLVLSSHLEIVHEDERLDDAFVADFLLGGDPGPERTIWADSGAIAQGSILTARDRKVHSERYWAPDSFAPRPATDSLAAAAAFRDLFGRAVQSRLTPDRSTWAELSGGLDSSSIVSMAQRLAESGVAATGVSGTITIVDELGSGDERPFSDAVLEHSGLRAEFITNPWPWQDDGVVAPRTDEPHTFYPFFARDRLECSIARLGGAEVLLSGMGSDHYLYGNRFYFSDLLARGHPVRALHELSVWTVACRQSFWKALVEDIVAPFLPPRLAICRLPQKDGIPGWIQTGFARRLGLPRRLELYRTLTASPGTRFARSTANALQELTRWLQRGSFEDRLEMRYPYLSRPLVEFALQLPPELRMKPLAPKWILREAMRGVLPEVVRTRSGKGGIDARIIWALSRERDRVDAITRDPFLAQSGFLDGHKLRSAVEEARRGRVPNTVTLLAALALETWLYVRSGRWTVRERPHQTLIHV
jgi:asparagine synthase (glutamine-hydrolysing)